MRIVNSRYVYINKKAISYMSIRSRENLVGAWAFLIGIILALGVGILSFGELNPFIFGIILVLGLVVGFFINVDERDAHSFLLASVSVVIVSFAGISSIQNLVTFAGWRGIKDIEIIGLVVGGYVSGTLGALLMLLIPATIVVAIKSLFSIAKR